MKEITKEIKDYLLSVGYPVQEEIYYLDVWLWLWREKKINLTPEYDQISGLFISCGVSERDDPEEAIEAAIEDLVTNKLLK